MSDTTLKDLEQYISSHTTEEAVALISDLVEKQPELYTLFLKKLQEQ